MGRRGQRNKYGRQKRMQNREKEDHKNLWEDMKKEREKTVMEAALITKDRIEWKEFMFRIME